MGKTSAEIQAAAVVAIVAASIQTALDVRRNVEVTSCPSRPAEQHHLLERQFETQRPECPVAAVVGGFAMKAESGTYSLSGATANLISAP
jgi:hypothetical protein